MISYRFIREFKSTVSAAETEPTPTGTSGTFLDLCPTRIRSGNLCPGVSLRMHFYASVPPTAVVRGIIFSVSLSVGPKTHESEISGTPWVFFFFFQTWHKLPQELNDVLIRFCRRCWIEDTYEAFEKYSLSEDSASLTGNYLLPSYVVNMLNNDDFHVWI